MRSPRLDNPVPESKSERKSTSKSKTKSKSKSDCLSLSLIVNADEHQPVPLKIFRPMLLGEFHLRRSPRFIPPLQNDAAIVYSTPNSSQRKMQDERSVGKSMKRPRLVHASSLRTSSRMNSGSADDIHRIISGSGSGISSKSGSKKVMSCLGKLESRNSDEKLVRRSPRFRDAIIGAEAESAATGADVAKRQRSRGPELPLSAELEDQKVILEILDVTSIVDRSPRLVSTQSECRSFSPNTPSPKMLELLEKRCLRSGSRNNSNLLSDAKQCLSRRKDGDKGTMPFKHFDVELLGEKHLRQSPRLHSSARELDREPSMENLDVKPLDGMKCRRSPRFSSSSRNANLKMIRQKETSKVRHKEKKSSKVISPSIETNEWHLEVATTLDNSSPSVLDEKCLTCSSETIISVSKVENGRIKCGSFVLPESDENPPKRKFKTSTLEDGIEHRSSPSFIGERIPDDEAQKRWGWRYELKKKSKDQIDKINDNEEDEIIVNVECHYAQAEIGNCIFSLEDCAYIKTWV